MQTATSIEWLIEQLNKQKEEMPISFYVLCEQAKDIHAQELINAFTLGYVSDKADFENFMKLFKK